MNNKEKIIDRYEVIFIAKKEDKEKVRELSEKIKSTDNLKNFENELWKEAKPAYKIKDIEESEYALYFLMKFDCERKELKSIDSILKSSSFVRRYRILNAERNSKKMKVGKIQNPKPRVRRKPSNFSRNGENYKSRAQETRSSLNKE